MSDFRYLDYEGLATYTEQVKGYADGKIVYLSDESEIPDPPKEGTLYVIGSEILMDEEIIIGTQTSSTSAWTGKSIDTRLHNGKRIAYYLPYSSIEGTPSTLTLELNDEDNTITSAIHIISEGEYFNKVISGGSVIRMIYFENVMMNGNMVGGWICDGNIIQNNVKYTGTLVDEQVATFEGLTGTIKASGYTIAKSVPSNAVFTDTVYTHPTTAGNKHIPSGGGVGQYLKYSSSGTAVWAKPYNSKTQLTSLSTWVSPEIITNNITIPAYSWCHIKAIVISDDASIRNIVPLEFKLANSSTSTNVYYIGHSAMMPGISTLPGDCELWYYNNSSSQITTRLYIYNPSSVNIQLSTNYTYIGETGGTLATASYYEIIS